MTLQPVLIRLEAPGLATLSIDLASGFIGQKLDLGDAVTRDSVDDAPDADGTDDTTEFIGARNVTLEVIVDGSFDVFDLTQRLRAFTHVRLRPTMFIQQTATAPLQQVTLRRSKFTDVLVGDDDQPLTVQWVAPLGIVESAELHEQIVSASGGTTTGVGFDWSFDLSFGDSDPIGSATVINAGNADAYPLLRIYGPCEDPSIQNTTQGKQLAFVGLTIDAGEFLEIDTRRNTILYQGVAGDSRYDTLDFPNSDWWTLSPGANEVVFEAADYSPPAQCQFVFRDAWL